MGRRIRWLGLVLVLCFAAVLAQLVNVQLRQASALDAASTNPRNASRHLDNFRGTILTSDGTVLARSVPVPNHKPTQYEYARTYPGGFLYSGMVGYDSLLYGTAGVENVYNTQLSLHPAKARTLSQVLSPPPPTTDDVTLTVTPSVQLAAYRALASNPDTFRDGAVVALNPKTGAVLAMYSSPSYDPNALSSLDAGTEKLGRLADLTKDAEGFAPLNPMATFSRFLPGSTYKVVTSGAVYNLRPTLSNFHWGPGKCTKPGTIPGTINTVCNDGTTKTASACGGTMLQMLPQSCDPGYVMLGLAVGSTAMYRQSNLFGVNSKAPIDLTTVSPSHFPAPATFVTGSKGPGRAGLAYAAFGQGTVSVTPLQNAMVAAAVAETGRIMAPHVLSQIRDAQGALVEKYKPTVYKQALSPAAAHKVSVLMQLVTTTPSGTAYGVFPAQDQVAAKTGTAQVKTAFTRTDDWMIGFAPASDPIVAVAVGVPYQPKTGYGATVAGPIMEKVISAALAAAARRGTLPTTTTTAPLPTTTTSTSSTTTTTVPATTTTV
ncbi:MAG: penicillin-binding transpeptidase domain-containing protein, partial [Acidimicrobiales bacterium]